MSVRNLERLFAPRSVAVIGASRRPGRVGSVVMRNLLAAGFGGPVMPVHPRYESVGGVLCYPDVGRLPIAPDLAIVCTPAAVVPEVVAELGRRGTRAAVILTAGLTRLAGSGRTLQDEMLEAAHAHSVRLLGPNCLGVLVPKAGLNASFAHVSAAPGSIAFVSQSGALCTAVLDWASARGIGFSHFVSLGDMADVDFGDVLDYLGGDPETRAILLYIESITSARKFMSAARAAARNKVVLCVKSGRVGEGARAAASHTGALAGSDEVYDAAIRRAGMLRVFAIDELFSAVETLARSRPLKGERLAILTNGGGPGVLATDALIERGGTLAELTKATVQRLDAVLPATWSGANPVDIIGDAGADRYGAALDAILEDENVDAVLIMHVPTAISSSTEAARAVVERSKGSKRNVLTSWLGQSTVGEARRIFGEAGVPTYDTPEQAVGAFLHTIKYRRNQETLMEVPPSVSEEFRRETDAARAVIDTAIQQGRHSLTEPEAKTVLGGYSIPVVETRVVSSVDEACEVASSLGFPVALKVLSPDISHKSDIGGVVLDLDSPEAVREAAHAMQARVAAALPDARCEGFTVQQMARRPGAHELIVGVTTDPTFGPVVLFGQGGTAVEVIGDRALGLPPLNMNLARELVSRTRVWKMLQGYRNRPPADLDAVCLTLLKVSQLVIDRPEIVELDINPLLVDERDVLALDARIEIRPVDGSGAERMAIRPYPRELEEWATLDSGLRLLLRPIRPEDEPAHVELFRHFEPEDARFRFFGLVRSFPHSQMARFTQIDYDREMAFIASHEAEGESPATMGVVRIVTNQRDRSAEFAVIVRSDIKGVGLGRVLLEKMIRYCRQRGIREIVGQVLEDNRTMLGLARSLGFACSPADGGIVDVRLPLEA